MGDGSPQSQPAKRATGATTRKAVLVPERGSIRCVESSRVGEETLRRGAKTRAEAQHGFNSNEIRANEEF